MTLSPQLADFARAWVEEDGIGFEVLTDLGNGVARDYGLVFRLPPYLREVYLDPLGVDLPRFNGDNSWELPMPGTFVVDGGGIVRWASVDPDYTVRPEPDDVLEAVRSAGGAATGAATGE